MKITEMRMNGIKEPVGFALRHPVVSWKVEDAKGKKASHVRVEVGTDLSFRNVILTVTDDRAKAIGTDLDISLEPEKRYYWRVSVEADNGERAQAVSFFETGKMDNPWQASWIAPRQEDKFHPVLEKKFTCSRKIRCARLYISGVGLFEAYLNGRKVGDEYLTPYVTNYEKELQVITFPAEDLLTEDGENRLDILLGKGWYMGLFGLELQSCNYGDRMAAIAELHLLYEDGSKEVIPTDGSWNYRGSDIEDSGIYDGETINHLLWEGKDNPWKPVDVLDVPETYDNAEAPDSAKAQDHAETQDNSEQQDHPEVCGIRNLKKSHLHDRLSLPVWVMETIRPVEIIHTPAGETVVDFGQNFAGFVRFQASPEKLPSGTEIKLEFGEILQQGNFYHKNYRDAKSEFIYISDGRSEEVRAHFTFFGFRYVKITGWPGEPSLSDFEGCVLYSALERTGFLETGDPKINRLYANTIWGQKSNFIDMPTDCPQRSERLGWTGDAQVFAPTASYHMDTEAFYYKFEKDLRDEQVMINGAVPNYVPNIGHKTDAGPVWGDVGTFLPADLYHYYGNVHELEDAYPMMHDWVEWIRRQDEAPSHEKKRLFDFGFTFGDWLALDGATPTSFKGSTDDTYVASVYYCRSAKLVSEAAAILRKNAETVGTEAQAAAYAADERFYLNLSEEIRKAILDEYFTPTGRLSIDTQSGLVIALHFDICPDREKIKDQLRTRLKKDLYKIKGGFVGAPLLCTVLAENGMEDIAYDFLFNEEFPGWLFEVNMGATTIWERWNSVGPDGTISDTGMNSLNHYSYGSVMEFVYAYAAGIRAAEPGFAKAVIAPCPDARLKKLSCRYDSKAGQYAVSWEIHGKENAGTEQKSVAQAAEQGGASGVLAQETAEQAAGFAEGDITVSVTIPFGSTARVILPRDPEGRAMDLDAGEYTWTYTPTKDFRSVFGWDTPIRKAASVPQALGILGEKVPPLAGMCHDPEMGCNTFRDFLSMTYIPIDPGKLEEAVEELEKIKI